MVQRAETLPSVERTGLTGTTTEWRNLLVFRKAVTTDADAFEPELLPAPDATPLAPAAVAAVPDTSDTGSAARGENGSADAAFEPGTGATQMLTDNGVEETSEVSGMTASLRKLASRRSGSDLGQES